MGTNDINLQSKKETHAVNNLFNQTQRVKSPTKVKLTSSYTSRGKRTTRNNIVIKESWKSCEYNISKHANMSLTAHVVPQYSAHRLTCSYTS